MKAQLLVAVLCCATSATGCTVGDDQDEILTFEATDSYSEFQIEKWTVLFSQRYQSEPEALDDMKRYMNQQLAQITDVLPSDAIEILSDVTLWVEYSPDGDDGGAYHPSREWLVDNDENPDKAQSPEFGYSDFLDQDEQPAIVLHELAHAFEDRMVNEDHPALVAAYDNAIGLDGYRSAAHVDGTSGRAYALTDPSEYFAELTEAYFVSNDVAPFDRGDLLDLDPDGYALIEQLWGANT